MAYRIPLFDLNFDEAETRAVVEVLQSRWISMGPKTAELERAFAAHRGARHAVAVSSGTAALHLALAALGIGSQDEVIVPAMTFVATVSAVGYVGARPVFADVTSLEDFSIDPEHVRRLVGPRTKAILPMHYAGFVCDMGSLARIAEEHKLCLIEDAAHAPASACGGRPVGTLGHAGCFSFFSNKNVACAEGGMVVTDREEVAAKVRLLRSHGMTTLSYDRAQGHATAYDVVARGYNYRLDDIRAAIALVQLGKLPGDVARRAHLRRLYCERLEPVDEILIPYREHAHAASHYIFPIVLKSGGPARRDAIRAELARRGVETSVHYPAVHRLSIYRSEDRRLPRTEFLADHEISLPLFGRLTEDQVACVAESVAASVRAHRG